MISVDSPVRVSRWKQDIGGQVVTTEGPSAKIGFTTFLEPGETFIVDLPGLFFCVPISSAFFREVHPTRTTVRESGELLVIRDDNGRETAIDVEKPVRDAIIEECRARRIPIEEGSVPPFQPGTSGLNFAGVPR